jgi:hypothetical protein
LYGPWFDSVLSSLLLVFLADCATCGFLYKNHYGRSILHEVEEVAGSDCKTNWVYDEETHKYRKKTCKEKEVEAEEARIETIRKQEEKNTKNEKEQKKREIDKNKRETRAAKVIQKWWRKVLYEPPNGIFYLRAKSNFSNQFDS